MLTGDYLRTLGDLSLRLALRETGEFLLEVRGNGGDLLSSERGAWVTDEASVRLHSGTDHEWTLPVVPGGLEMRIEYWNFPDATEETEAAAVSVVVLRRQP